jgi:hypothetical protein
MNSGRGAGGDSGEDLIKAYKAQLAAVIDRRPSGARQRIADALGKHRSFVTQMTSTAYPTPVPQRHLATIFAVCHFSAEERKRFLDAYFAAHPERRSKETEGKRMRHLSLTVFDLGDEARNREFDDAVAQFAHRISAIMAGGDE